jgi:hypothetical protein
VKQDSMISLGLALPPLVGPRKKLSTRMRVLVGLGVLLLLSAFVDACAPEIDNVLGIWRHFDVRAVQDLKVAGKHLGQVVGARYHALFWQSSHRENIWITEVVCRARDARNQPVTLAWEVGRWTSPAYTVPPRRLYILPLTRAAYRLTPQLGAPGITEDRYAETDDVTGSFYYRIPDPRYSPGDPPSRAYTCPPPSSRSSPPSTATTIDADQRRGQRHRP